MTLTSGAFFVGYLRRFGLLGTGVGSQIYIGQLLAYGAALTRADLGGVALAGVLAVVGSVVPRMLSGPAEHPAPVASLPLPAAGAVPPEMRMGLQAALSALVIVFLNDAVGLDQSAWAITAGTYVVAGSAGGTIDRLRRRIIGTIIGVPMGIACLPLAVHIPLLAWSASALAMIIYAVALPNRYDIACGAYAFSLMATLAVTGEHSLFVLASRAWETLLGAPQPRFLFTGMPSRNAVPPCILKIVANSSETVLAMSFTPCHWSLHAWLSRRSPSLRGAGFPTSPPTD